MSANFPPPGYPLVQGNYALDADWTIQLPDQFARRIEHGSLVLWRPGLTIWIVAWENDNNETQSQRLQWIKAEASPARVAQRESKDGKLTRLSYRLRDESEDGPVESLSAYIIADDGHLQISIYFDDVADEFKAQQIADSVTLRKPL